MGRLSGMFMDFESEVFMFKSRGVELELVW